MYDPPASLKIYGAIFDISEIQNSIGVHALSCDDIFFSMSNARLTDGFYGFYGL